MFIDTHCHFDFPPFMDHCQELLQRAIDAKLIAIIVPAVSADRFDMICQLTCNHPLLFGALGLHPIYSHGEQDLETLQQALHLRHDKIIAVGEIGLDKYVSTPDWSEQYGYFTQQLQLAKRYDLPVLLHSRRAHEPLYQALRKIDLPCRGIVHGFAGSFEQAMRFVKLGYLIGVGGVITYERAQKTRKTIAQLPLSSLVLETDAPDMPLSGYQGQANRPDYLPLIFNQLCLLRPEPAEVIAEALLTNTLTLFNRIHKIIETSVQ